MKKKQVKKYIDGGKEYKICTCCGNHKLNTSQNFYVSKGTKDGLENQCKKCRYLKKRNYAILNREKVREQNRKYNEKYGNKYYIERRNTQKKIEEERKRQREYYKKNRKKILENQRKYYYKVKKLRMLGIIK